MSRPGMDGCTVLGTSRQERGQSAAFRDELLDVKSGRQVVSRREKYDLVRSCVTLFLQVGRVFPFGNERRSGVCS